MWQIRNYSICYFLFGLVILNGSCGDICVAQTITAQRIWSPDTMADALPNGNCYFRKSFVAQAATSATLEIDSSGLAEVHLNGSRIGQVTNRPQLLDVTEKIRPGKNILAIKVSNQASGKHGLMATLEIQTNGQPAVTIVSDTTWKTSTRPLPLWNMSFYSDAKWVLAASLVSPADQFRASASKAANKNTPLSRPNHAAKTPSINLLKSESIESTSKVAPSQISSRPNVPQQQAQVPSVVANGRILPSSLSKPTFAVPNDFAVEHIATNQHVGSLLAIEFNEFGQIIASREKGSLLRIFDSDNDGSLDTVEECCQEVTNVQGIIPLNGELIVTGIGSSGSAVYRLSDPDQNGIYDQVTTIVKFTSDAGEHGAHALALGPDGYIYALLGNHASVDATPSESSPYKVSYEGQLIPRVEDPGGHASGIKAPGGTIVRFKLNGEKLETFAGGLRNAYDMTFDASGQLFTHDSDMESDEGTTWYRPTRVLHVIPGAEFGWRSGWAKWPEYFHDSLPSVATTGRGSPTGMTVYTHNAFPRRYHNTIFSGDWSSGQILVFRNNRQGAGVTAQPVPFVRGKPLNVTDLAVGPDGWLYFATGGRGSAGNLYRVVWKGPPTQPVVADNNLDKALRQPQSQSAFARQQIALLQAEMGDDWNSNIIGAARDYTRPAMEQARALQLMKLYGPAPSNELLQAISRANDEEVRATAAYFMAMSPDEPSKFRLTEMLSDESAFVRRVACESLLRAGYSVSISNLEKMLASTDRHEAWAARRLLQESPTKDWQTTILTTTDQRVFVQGSTALMLANPNKELAEQILIQGQKLMNGFVSDPTFIDMLRLFQITLERSQLTANDVAQFANTLAEEYPSSNELINRELMRLLSYLQVDSIMDRYFAELRREDLPSMERIHLAIHLAYLNNGWTSEKKFELLNRLAPPEDAGNSVPGYLQNVSLAFGKKLTPDESLAAIENGHLWPNAAMAATLQLEKNLTSKQIEQLKSLDKRLATDKSEKNKRLKIVILAILARDGSEPSMSYLREVFDRDEDRRVEIAYGLSENITQENFDYVVRSLTLLDKSSAISLLQKLKTVNRWPDSGEQFRTVIRIGEKFGSEGANDAVALLEYWRGFAPSNGTIPWTKAITAWKRWYLTTYPDLPLDEVATAVATSPPKSQPTLQRQPAKSNQANQSPTFLSAETTARVDNAIASALPGNIQKKDGKWDEYELLAYLMDALPSNAGSSEPGQAVFVKAECSKCHRFQQLGETMGPELTNIASRFTTAEILGSIVNPSKDISDQYAAKSIVTSSGNTYHGIVAAGTDDDISILLSNGRKVRVRNDEIEKSVDSKTSAMPDGLLNDLTLQEIVDLFTLMSSSDRFSVAERTDEQTR